MIRGHARTARAAALVATALLAAGCVVPIGGSEPPPVATPVADLPADKITPEGETVPAGDWLVYLGPMHTRDMDGVKKGTRSHIAVKVAKVTRAERGSIPASEVQVLGGGVDVSQTVPYHVELTTTVLSGWPFESADDVAIDPMAVTGDGELLPLTMRTTRIKQCPGMPPNTELGEALGTASHTCLVVLGTGSAAPKRLVVSTSGEPGDERQERYMALPEPSPAAG